MSGAILVTGTGHTLCDGGNGQNDGAWAGAAREEQPGASESLDRTMKAHAVRALGSQEAAG